MSRAYTRYFTWWSAARRDGEAVVGFGGRAMRAAVRGGMLWIDGECREAERTPGVKELMDLGGFEAALREAAYCDDPRIDSLLFTTGGEVADVLVIGGKTYGADRCAPEEMVEFAYSRGLTLGPILRSLRGAPKLDGGFAPVSTMRLGDDVLHTLLTSAGGTSVEAVTLPGGMVARQVGGPWLSFRLAALPTSETTLYVQAAAEAGLSHHVGDVMAEALRRQADVPEVRAICEEVGL